MGTRLTLQNKIKIIAISSPTSRNDDFIICQQRLH